MAQQQQLERRSTAAERWQPLNEVEQVSERIRRMLDQTFGGFGFPTALTETAAWSPPVDLEETDDAFVLEADLPGVKREDVNIEVIGNEVSISGEVQSREPEGTQRRRMRRSGRFEYRLSLPSHVDTDKIDASLKEGVLTLRIPKTEKAQRRRIEVKA